MVCSIDQIRPRRTKIGKRGVVRWPALVLACAALFAIPAQGAAPPSPSFRVDFSGSGVQHLVDTLRYVDDTDGSCFARERIDETANVVWTASTAKSAQGIAGSAVTGTGVRDSCDGPAEKAPAEWLRQTTCSGQLELVAPPAVTITRTNKTLVLVLTGPRAAAPVGSGCTLVVRADELVAHVSIPLAKLNPLKRGRSLTVAIGTSRPGPGDYHAPHVDCSRPAKPYEGYKVADACTDDLTWSGTAKVTRV
jgi:hypothetical protein